MSSRATGAARCGIHSEVRWSGTNERSNSSHGTSHTRSSASPRWCRTVTGASGADSTDSLMSDRTEGLQHWATNRGPRSPAAEGLAVDEPDPGGHRVHPHPGEGHVEERDRRMHDEDDIAAGHRRRLLQQGHGALGNHRRSGHRVDHGTLCCHCGEEVVDDGPVDLLEGVTPLVVVVERAGRGKAGHRRVPGGPEEERRGRRHERQGFGGDQLGPGRAEPDHVDPRGVDRLSGRHAGKRTGRFSRRR